MTRLGAMDLASFARVPWYAAAMECYVMFPEPSLHWKGMEPWTLQGANVP